MSTGRVNLLAAAREFRMRARGGVRMEGWMASSAPIGDYAAIGDGRSVALVSRSGAVDWLCWPRFDSPSLFAAILDEQKGGRWRIAPPTGTPVRVRRRYLPATNVLETTFETPGGSVRIVDLLPVLTDADRRQELLAEHELLRVVECTSGEVELESVVDVRPDYARTRLDLHPTSYGLCGHARGAAVVLRGEVAHGIDASGAARARFALAEGRSAAFSLSWSSDGPAVLPALGHAARERVRRTAAWWRAWAAHTTYHGPDRDAVVRGRLVLKLLVYAPSGAVLAAPTTSLPERAGGDLNWDYRYCWLRDASFTLRALIGVGCHAEAVAFGDWLLHSTWRSRPQLSPFYDVFGRRAPQEEVLRHLSGWRGSHPVRIGNAARHQLQLDVYGEVVEAAARLATAGYPPDRAGARFLVELGRWVCDHWRDPDWGIWEPREPPRERTHSRLMCWVALDRLVRLAREGLLHASVPLERFERERDAIRADIESRAFDPALGSYTDPIGSGDVDAALLRMSIVGFEDASSPRMRATFARVDERLRAAPGLYHRYRDGASPGEGAFGLCGFWAAEYLALAGRIDDARAVFDAAASHANDVGLFGEQIDPRSGAALGNFPQAFTHVGLMNAAATLAKAETRRSRPQAPTAVANEEEARP